MIDIPTKRSEMAELNENQLHRIRRALNDLDRVLAEVDPSPTANGAAARRSLPPEPRNEAEMRRQWQFLQALEAAGGSVTAPELSRIGRESGYRSGRALNGYYRGRGAALRKNGQKRELTAAGKRFVERYQPLFGTSQETGSEA
jgi:hypothetical protein